MRRLHVVSLLLIAALTLTLGYFLSGRGAQAKGVRLNAKALPEHGLDIVAPTDPTFDQEVVRLVSGRGNKQKHLVEALKPFSVFVKNRGRRDVIAYRLRWDMLRPDGTVTTHITSYAEPGALMGRDHGKMSEESRKAGVSIRGNSGRYVSLAASIDEAQDPDASLNIGASVSGGGDLNRIQQSGADGDEAAMLDAMAAQLAQAESLTVSLDAAVFDDGTFVGADSLGYFMQLQAAVSAKRDLLQSSLLAVQRDQPVAQVFEEIEALTREPDVSIGANATQDDYYRFYKKAFAEEVLRVRGSIGDDRTAMWHVVQPVYRVWPKLRRRQ